MLDLDSAKWRQLQHAYGSAEDIPALLRLLPTAPVKPADYKTEPWFSLWSTLCHQDDIYSASYAAVPHITAVAASRPPHERWDFVHLVTRIEVCRHYSDAPPIHSEFEADYFAALEQMRVLVLECLRPKLDKEDDIKVFLSGLAVLNGLPNLANAIIELPEPNVCPNCETDVQPFGYELP